jgi:hypothetical protein
VSDFITIYTDASVKNHIMRTQVAWRGKCQWGMIEGVQALRHDGHVARAEMRAILCGVHDAIFHYPEVTGLFINSDNLQCVQTFWSFLNRPPHHEVKRTYEKILEIADGRWIRAKHVKAHTGGKDVRSWMNRRVDKLTRSDYEENGSRKVYKAVVRFKKADAQRLICDSGRLLGDPLQQRSDQQSDFISQAPDEPIHYEVV